MGKKTEPLADALTGLKQQIADALGGSAPGGPSWLERCNADVLAGHMAAYGPGLPDWVERIAFARLYREIARDLTGTFEVYVSGGATRRLRRVWLSSVGINLETADHARVARVDLVDGRFAEYVK